MAHQGIGQSRLADAPDALEGDQPGRPRTEEGCGQLFDVALHADQLDVRRRLQATCKPALLPRLVRLLFQRQHGLGKMVERIPLGVNGI